MVHGAFQHGSEATGWNSNQVLKGIYKLFNKCPVRRGFYLRTTDSYEFPLSFCSISWLDSVPTAKRAVKIWDNIVATIRAWQRGPKQDRPKSFYYTKVCEYVEDPLMVAKLEYFCYVASILKPYLEKYQMDAPIVPMLYDDLSAIFSSLLALVLKAEYVAQLLKSGLSFRSFRHS